MLRALAASLLLLRIGVLILGSIPWRWSGLPLFAAGLLLGALVGAGFGLLLGTLVQPMANRSTLFSLVFTPLLLHGVQPVSLAVSRPVALVPGDHRSDP